MCKYAINIWALKYKKIFIWSYIILNIPLIRFNDSYYIDQVIKTMITKYNKNINNNSN